MDKCDVQFAELDVTRRSQAFISFPAVPKKRENPSVRITKSFTQLLAGEHGKEFHVNYVRDRGGQPWLAVTTEPAAVDESTASVGIYDESGTINSTHLVRLLAAQYADGRDEGIVRLYYAHETESLGEHWILYRLESRDQ